MISIIITYYIGLNILQSSLSLLLHNLTKDAEIIIVNDNPNSTLTSTMLPDTNNIPLKILSMPQNEGYASACNYGAQYAVGKYLIFMDSDIFVARGWLENLLDAYEHTANCGAVSTTILNLNQKRVVHWGLGMNKGIEVIKPFRDGILPEKAKHKTYEFNMASSGCILIPKEIFEQVGGFDEQFYNGFCDLDLTYRITQSGLKCLYSSDAIVYHRGKVSGSIRLAAEDDTRALFIRKWANNLPDDGMELLEKLYQFNINFEHSNNYFFINFSRSLFVKDYHAVLLKCLEATQTNYYELKIKSSSFITLEDYIPWSICGIHVPIVYFVDNIMEISNNQHWFMHRLRKGDLIADRNGNLIPTDQLLI